MTYGFAHDLQTTWSSLTHPHADECEFDLLYLAFKDVGGVSAVEKGTGARRLQQPGIWEASAYVLSRDGALKLLHHLPAYGPIDLWLNMQFGRLRAFTATRPLIEQRVDEPSTNSYSVLPVLSQVGVITREKPLVSSAKHLDGPVVALGDPCTGLTALATALAMLGYTCVSDLENLPSPEQQALLTGGRGRLFNAYVNIGSISVEALSDIFEANPGSRFILTSPDRGLPATVLDRTLNLTPDVVDKWATLTDFLGIDYPSFDYPTDLDLGLRTVDQRTVPERARHSTDLKHDTGPWILKSSGGWGGIAVDSVSAPLAKSASVDWTAGEKLEQAAWALRDDTFPSNMALFRPGNVSQAEGRALLILKHEPTSVRSLTSGAIATRASYRYGTFSADLRPAGTPGLVTGVFLHRNAPRQEIDIEFLGRDTRRMLVNVFYNPGPEGTKLEYGYRGTPTLVDLGFDAAEDFHTYEIDWQPRSIRWLVDGALAYERTSWDPTPIPDQPLQFNLNLWHSRSREFAGRLDSSRLPVSANIRSIEIRSATRPASDESVNSLSPTTGETPESTGLRTRLAPPRADRP